MKTFIVMSSSGKDSPGILNNITKRLKEYNANIEVQRISTVAGFFTILLLISVNEDKADSLLSFLNRIQGESYSVNAQKAVSKSLMPSDDVREAHLHVTGADKVGIVDMVTLTLLESNVNITAVNQDVSAGEKPKIDLRADLVIPKTVDTGELSLKLENIKRDFDVDVELKYAV